MCIVSEHFCKPPLNPEPQTTDIILISRKVHFSLDFLQRYTTYWFFQALTWTQNQKETLTDGKESLNHSDQHQKDLD